MASLSNNPPDYRLTIGVHKCKCPGITLTYTVKGLGPLVVIQAAGWGISSRYLQIGLQPLESHFTLLYPEPRGSGPSDPPENLDEMSSADMADDLERLRDHLGLETIDLLGHSNGGTIALDYAERYANRVRKLLLLTHWLSGYDDSANWKRFIEQRRDASQYKKSIATIEGPRPDTQDEWVQYMCDMLPFYVVDVDKHFPPFMEAMGVPSLWVNKAQHAADAKRPTDLHANLRKVTARTLCLGCEEDPVTTSHVARVTAEGIEGADCVIIENCGHFPWVEKPEEFFWVVIKFFEDGRSIRGESKSS